MLWLSYYKILNKMQLVSLSNVHTQIWRTAISQSWQALFPYCFFLFSFKITFDILPRWTNQYFANSTTAFLVWGYNLLRIHRKKCLFSFDQILKHILVYLYSVHADTPLSWVHCQDEFNCHQSKHHYSLITSPSKALPFPPTVFL